MADFHIPSAIAAFRGRRSTAPRSSLYRTRDAVAPRCVVPFNMMDYRQEDYKGGSAFVGKISPWIDLDSQNETFRGDSETAFKHEIAHASRLSLQACLLPVPKGNSCANYASCVNQALQALDRGTSMQLWLRIPLVTDRMEATPGSLDDSWEVWNSFRLLCGHQDQLSVALDITSISLPSANSLQHWFGESVRALIFHKDCFQTTPSGGPCLSEHHKKLLGAFFNPSIQVVLSEELAHSPPKTSSDSPANSCIFGVEKHPLRPYVDHLISLCERMDALPEPQLLEITCTDYFQLLSQTFMDKLEAEPPEAFEKVQPVMDNPKAEHTETFGKGTSEYIQKAAGVDNVYRNGTVGRGGSSSRRVSMSRAFRPIQNGINGGRNPPAPGGADGPGGGAPQPPHPPMPLQPPQPPAMLPVIRNTYYVHVFAGFIDRAAFPTADLLHAEVLRLLSTTDEIPLPLQFVVLYHTSYDDDFIQVDGPYNELADEHVQQILFVIGNDDEVDPPPEGFPPWYPPWHVG